jgi:hypothetical protein
VSYFGFACGFPDSHAMALSASELRVRHVTGCASPNNCSADSYIGRGECENDPRTMRTNNLFVKVNVPHSCHLLSLGSLRFIIFYKVLLNSCSFQGPSLETALFRDLNHLPPPFRPLLSPFLPNPNRRPSPV